MTPEKFKEELTKAEALKNYKDRKFTFEFSPIPSKKELNGLSELFTFCVEQIEGWHQLGEKLPDEFKTSKEYFSKIKEKLSSFLLVKGEYKISDYFKDLTNLIDRSGYYKEYHKYGHYTEVSSKKKYPHIFPFEIPEVKFESVQNLVEPKFN